MAPPPVTMNTCSIPSSTRSCAMKSATRMVLDRILGPIFRREYVPTLLEHLDPLGIFLLDGSVVLALIEQPEQFEMHGFDKTLFEIVLLERNCVENDLPCLES